MGVDGRDDLRGQPVDRARQAGAVERVDDNGDPAMIPARQRHRRPPPGLGGLDRISGARVGRTIGRNRDPEPAVAQHARGDIAVAAIVAGAAEHHHRRAERRRPRHRIGDGDAGPLHQHPTRRPSGDGEPVGLGHRGGGQEGGVVAHGTHCRQRNGAGQSRAPDGSRPDCSFFHHGREPRSSRSGPSAPRLPFECAKCTNQRQTSGRLPANA